MVRALAWIGVLAAAGVLATSAWAFGQHLRQPPAPGAYRPRFRWTDAWLLAAWLFLLAGSLGLLASAPWAGTLLRLWIAMLVLWTLLYLGSSLYGVRGMDEHLPGAQRSVRIAAAVVLAAVGGLAALVLWGLSGAR